MGLRETRSRAGPRGGGPRRGVWCPRGTPEIHEGSERAPMGEDPPTTPRGRKPFHEIREHNGNPPGDPVLDNREPSRGGRRNPDPGRGNIGHLAMPGGHRPSPGSGICRCTRHLTNSRSTRECGERWLSIAGANWSPPPPHLSPVRLPLGCTQHRDWPWCAARRRSRRTRSRSSNRRNRTSYKRE